MKQLLRALTLGIFIQFVSLQVSGQVTVNLEVDPVDAAQVGGDCGDCNGPPDPSIDWHVKHSGTATFSATYNAACTDCGCNAYIGFSPTTVYQASGVNYSNTINIELNGGEIDGILCGPTDGDCGGFGAPNTGANNVSISSNSACSWTSNFNSGRTGCASDGSTNDYNTRWRYRYYFQSGYTAGSVTGTTTICSGASTNLSNSVSPTTNYNSFQWESSTDGFTWNPVTGSSGQLGINTGALTQTTYFRRAADYCTSFTGGVTTVYSNVLTITVTPTVGAAGSISGSTAICASSSGNVYSIAAVNNATTYTWSVPAGSTITNGQGSTSITVTFGTNSGNVSVTPSNTCFSGTGSSLAVTIQNNVGSTGTISGNATVCFGANGVTYSIPAVTNATNYTWTVPAGASIVSGASTNSISVNFGTATGGNITVQPSNTCFTGTLVSKAITIIPQLGANGTIVGPDSVCFGQTAVAYSTTAVSNATTYTWTAPVGATIASGQGTSSITINFGTAVTGNVSVVASNSCFTNASINKLVQVTPQVSAAGVISGDTTICFGDNGVPYSVNPVTGANSYLWTVPSGAVITAGQGTTSISVNYNTALSGTITVTPSNSCFSGTSSTLNIVVTPAIGSIGSVNGNSTPCYGATESYSIPAVAGADTYTWTVPSGATITSGQGTSAITLDLGTATSGSVSVIASNSCFATSAANLPLTITPALGAFGSISGSPVVCFGDNPVGYSTTPVTGATNYVWTAPAGATVISGQGSTSITVNYGTAASGNLIVTASNACFSADDTLAITVNPIPQGSISGTSTICTNGSDTIFFNFTSGTAPFDIAYTDGTNTFNLNNVNNGDFVIVSPTGTTTYSFLQINDAGGCHRNSLFAGSATITVAPAAAINSVTPTNPLCSNSNDGSIVIAASGGTAPLSYSIDGGLNFTVSQTTFTPLSAGTYNVQVVDALGCPALSAGLPANVPVTLTAPSVLDVSATKTDPSCAGVGNGSIIATGSGGTTPYQYSLNGGPSQISATFNSLPAGNYQVTIIDGHSCTDTFSISLVNTYAVSASVDTQHNVSCFGGNDGFVTILFTGGVNPVTYSLNGGLPQASPTFSGLSAGTYTITARDGNGCTQILSVGISQPGLLSLQLDSINNILCNGGANGSIYITAQGGTSPYTYVWSNGNGNEDLLNVGAGVYNVTVYDKNNCTASTGATITQPLPLYLNIASYTNVLCKGDSTGYLDITANGGTPPFQYNWSNGATSEDLVRLPVGTYAVTVTDANGCQRDTNQVIAEPAAVLAVSAVADSVTCNGSANGGVTLTVSGGTPQYTYVWNNGASTSSISGLSGGVYSVTVRDGNGCTAYAYGAVYEPQPLTLSHVVTNSPCAGTNAGAIDLTVSGGNPAYTYLWTTGATTQDITNLGSGLFQVTVTDAKGCTSTDSARVFQPNFILRVTVNTTDLTCYGSHDGIAAAVAVGGTSPYKYVWNTVNLNAPSTLTGLDTGTYSVTVTDANGCTASASGFLNQPDSLTATATGTDLTCANGSNGSVTTTITGGTTPYSYLWSNFATSANLSNVGAGNYTVIVTDKNGCTATAADSVRQPAALGLSFTVRNIACKGASDGLVRVVASGGVNPYSYAWSNGGTLDSISGVAAGTYFVTVTDNNGCSNSGSATVTEPANALVASLVSHNISCNGAGDGSIDVTVNGGGTPYAFTWSNSATTEDISGLSAGNYSVTINDANGCSTTLNGSIAEPAILTASATGSNLICNGGTNGTVTSTVNGGTTPYSYLWSNFATSANLSNVGAGNYTVIVTDKNGCTATASDSVRQPAALGLSFTVRNVGCQGGNTGMVRVVASGGVNPYSYAWSNGGTLDSISGVAAGTYFVTVTDNNGCSNSGSATVTEPANALVASLVSHNISCNGAGDGSIDVTVNGGGTPYAFTWSNSATTEDISGLSAGNYSVTINDANGCSTTLNGSIAEPAILTASATGSNLICNGGTNGTVTSTVNGGTTPYSYLWSNFATSANLSNVGAGNYTVIVTDKNGCTATASDSVRQPAALGLSFTVRNVGCQGGNTGMVRVVASGGVNPYSYAWSNGGTLDSISGVAAGTYFVTVTDNNGCSNSGSATVTEPANALVASLVSHNISCNGAGDGSIDVTVNGGGTPYAFTWSNSATTEDISGLSAGNYSVTINDANGCSTTLNGSIAEPAILTASATGSNLICNGGTNGTVTSTVSGGTTPYSYLWSNFATSANLSNVGAGNYTVIVTDKNGCTATASDSVRQPAALGLSFTVRNVGCQGGNTGMVRVVASGGVNPYSYAWSNGGTLDSISGVAAGTYFVTVTDNNGCSNSGSATVSQPANPLVAAIQQYDITCAGANDGHLDVTVNGGLTPYNFTWSNGAITEDLTGLGAGNYSVTIADAGGCVATLNGSVAAPAPITSTISGTNVTCHGAQNGAVNLTPAGGTGTLSFLWSNFSAAEDLANIGGGWFTVIISDANGCQHRDSVLIVEPAAISHSIQATSISCYGAGNGALNLTAAGGTGTLLFSWSNGASTEDISGLNAGTYTVVIRDANNCQAVDSGVVTEPSAIGINHIVTQPRCNGDANGAVDVIVTGGTYPFTYAWSNSATSEDLSGLTGGVYRLTVTDSRGCVKTDSAVLVEPDGIIITPIVRNVKCKGNQDGDIDLSVYYGTPPYTYQWFNGSIGGTPLTINEDLHNLNGGTYCASITDSRGCVATLCAVVKEADSLKINMVKTDPSCQTTTGSVAVSHTGGTRPYQYLWNNFVTDSFQNNVAGGVYAVIVTDSNGCSQHGSITVNGQPNPMFTTISSSNPTCSGGDNGFVSVAVSGGAIPYAYNWNVGGQSGHVATNLTDGLYLVTVTDAAGCQKVDSARIQSPAPISVTTAASSTTCLSSSNGYAVVQATGGRAPYIYIFNGITQSGDTIRNLTAGTFSIIVRDANGCEGVSTFTVTSSTDVSVNLSANAEVVLKGQEVQLNASGISDTVITGYRWTAIDPFNFSGCGDSTNCTNPTITPQTTQTIIVTMVNARGCTASDTVQIQVRTEGAIFMPTAFTPNGDGLNDRFQFAVLGAKSASVQVWNRWGEKVYDDPEQPNGIDQTKPYGWDGMFRGKMCEFDTYTYQMDILFFDGHKESKSGTVTLMR
ncbi:MAG: gliding motility-associated C-terminal domain-containing protein [Chitinophagales bacterium]